MLKKFSNYLIVLFWAFVSQTSVWSNEQSNLFSKHLSSFIAESTDEIRISPLHAIEDTKEIVVAEKEIEEEQKNKAQVLSKDFNFNVIQLSTTIPVHHVAPDSYFSNHLYDLFCSWKSFLSI